MQRKNHLLNKSRRSGIAMIMAIMVIVVISTIMALGLRLSTQTTKSTVDLYVYEQAILLSKSAAEYALLRISQDNNATNPCNVTNLDFKPDMDNDGVVTNADYYDINVSIQYIYTAFPATCAAASQYATVTTPEQNGSVLMDITVSVSDTSITSEPIRYFRRSIQKL
ncbi:MAG: hypothetical protein Q9M43_01315 [Sulfurimonas sp.]|nr:hypothetical protein [Sulfurimonas sp.]